MPQLASNRDVNDQENWGKVLTIGALIGTAAAVGGVIGAHKNTKAILKNYDKEDVVKGLYGGKAKYFKTNTEGWENVVERNFKKYGDELAPNTPRYQAGKSTTGKAKMYRTDGNPVQNAWTNWTDKDLRIFNKELKGIQKGAGAGQDNIYAHSKLSLYSDLEGASKTLNTNTNELGRLTDDIYGSKKMANIRNAALGDGPKVDGIAKDIEVTNNIWGEKYGEKDPMNYKTYKVRQDKLKRKAKGGTEADFINSAGKDADSVFDTSQAAFGGFDGLDSASYGGASYYDAPASSSSSSSNKPKKKKARKSYDERASRRGKSNNAAPTPEPVAVEPQPIVRTQQAQPGQLKNKFNSFMDSEGSSNAQNKTELLRKGQEAKAQKAQADKQAQIERYKKQQEQAKGSRKNKRAQNIYDSAQPYTHTTSVKSKKK